MPTLRPIRLLPLLLSCLAGIAPGQQRTVLPQLCQNLPGNAALSLPLRWSSGTLQVRVDAALLPGGLVGRNIQGLRLRRPSFLAEPAYPAVQRTIEVRGGFQSSLAAQFTQDLLVNRPAQTTVVFGPAPVTVPATAAVGPGDRTGEEFLELSFSTPLPVVAGTLFLEFVTTAPAFVVDELPWVDGWWLPNGTERGYTGTLGNGSCTTRSQPTQLVWTASAGPSTGSTARLRLSGAAPGALVLAWFGLAPEARPVAPDYMGFGGSLAVLDPGLSGCHQWAPVDVSWSVLADLGGSQAVEFALPASFATTGTRLGVQAAWLDAARPGLPLSLSNGVALVVNSTGVGNRCASMYFPDSVTTSPWLPFYGQMPVLVLLHD